MLKIHARQEGIGTKKAITNQNSAPAQQHWRNSQDSWKQPKLETLSQSYDLGNSTPNSLSTF